MAGQVDQWAALIPHVVSYETVVAVKGVKIVSVTNGDKNDKIVNCVTFEDSIIELGGRFKEATSLTKAIKSSEM